VGKTILNTSNLTYSRLYSFLFLVIRVYFFIKGYLAIEWAPFFVCKQREKESKSKILICEQINLRIKSKGVSRLEDKKIQGQ